MRYGKSTKPVFSAKSFLLAVLLSAALPSYSYADFTSISVNDTGNAALKQLSDMFNAMLATKNSQSVVNGQHVETLNSKLLDVQKDYVITHPETYKACRVGQLSAATGAVRDGINSLSADMSNAPKQGVGVTETKQLNQACKNGNIDPTLYPDLAKYASNCKSFDPTRRDADITFATINKDDMMSLPTGAKFVNGAIVLPDISTLSDVHEKNYVDAYNVCLNSRASEPIVSAGGSPGQGASNIAATAVIAVQEERKATLRASGFFKSCIDEVNRNTAISLANGNTLGGEFKVLATAEQNWCASLIAMGIHDPALANCTTKGLSNARYEKINNDRFGVDANSTTNYQTYLQGKQMKPDQIAMVEESHRDVAMTNQLLRQIVNILQTIALNTAPHDNNGGPSPLLQTTK